MAVQSILQLPLHHFYVDLCKKVSLPAYLLSQFLYQLPSSEFCFRQLGIESLTSNILFLLGLSLYTLKKTLNDQFGASYIHMRACDSLSHSVSLLSEELLGRNLSKHAMHVLQHFSFTKIIPSIVIHTVFSTNMNLSRENMVNFQIFRFPIHRINY